MQIGWLVEPMHRKIIVLVLSLFLSIFTVNSQAESTLLPDTLIQETLSAGESQRYTFTAQDEQMLSFYAEAIDSTLDPVLRIYDSNDLLLLENDDYNYPDSRDALIETFSAPYAGTFVLEVSGYAESEGEYELLMLPGYGQALYRNDFDDLGNWEATAPEAESAATLEARNGLLILSQEGISQPAIATGFPINADHYYMETDVESITASSGWQVGLAFQYEDAENYAAVLVNQRGAWQISRVENGATSTLRDWNTHPTITPGEDAFTLGVLVNEAGAEIFYNGQYIGSVLESFSGNPTIGVMLSTVDALGSSVTARYESLLVTVPRAAVDSSPVPPYIITAEPAFVARSLERSGVIPAGGSSALNLPESFVQLGSVGTSRFPLASGQDFTDFLFGATINWPAQPATLNGCGLVVQDQGEADTYLLAYLDSQGGVGLSQRTGEEYSTSLFWDDREIGSPPYRTLLIVQEAGVLFYVNGMLIGTMETGAIAGGIGIAAINFEPTSTECQFEDIWLWQLR